MTEIERLAEAIEGYCDRPHAAESIVRAILTAMREPSEDMLLVVALELPYDVIEQGTVYDEYDSDPARLADHAVHTIWQAMIDHILAEPKETK